MLPWIKTLAYAVICMAIYLVIAHFSGERPSSGGFGLYLAVMALWRTFEIAEKQKGEA